MADGQKVAAELQFIAVTAGTVLGKNS